MKNKKEIEKLKDTLWHHSSRSDYVDNSVYDAIDEFIDYADDLQQRIDNTIKYIEEHKQWQLFSERYIVWGYQELLTILKGENNEK